jgi:hypothetical protein
MHVPDGSNAAGGEATVMTILTLLGDPFRRSLCSNVLLLHVLAGKARRERQVSCSRGCALCRCISYAGQPQLAIATIDTVFELLQDCNFLGLPLKIVDLKDLLMKDVDDTRPL